MAALWCQFGPRCFASVLPDGRLGVNVRGTAIFSTHLTRFSSTHTQLAVPAAQPQSGLLWIPATAAGAPSFLRAQYLLNHRAVRVVDEYFADVTLARGTGFSIATRSPMRAACVTACRCLAS